MSAPTPVIFPLAGQDGLRLATCLVGDKPRVVLVQDDGGLLDLEAEGRRVGMELSFHGDSMLSLITAGAVGLAQARALARGAGKTALTVHDVGWLSPLPAPRRNIFCVGWNYLEHFEEGKDTRADRVAASPPEHPVFFTKATGVMNGPFDAIPYDPFLTATADWEVELAVIIGRRGRDIAEEDAMAHVFGYSVFNDVSVREVQQKRHGGQWFKGKSLDGYGPMGPWIVTAAGVNLESLRLICRINRVEKQNCAYRQMYFKIPRIIAELSQGLTLEPGDIIATGTPSGVGFARRPPEFLKPDDIMETEIAGIGRMVNTIAP